MILDYKGAKINSEELYRALEFLNKACGANNLCGDGPCPFYNNGWCAFRGSPACWEPEDIRQIAEVNCAQSLMPDGETWAQGIDDIMRRSNCGYRWWGECTIAGKQCYEVEDAVCERIRHDN